MACVPDNFGMSDEDVQDPMVSNPIHPFIIPITLRHAGTGNESSHGSLIDSGCTRCLIRCSIVEVLGVRIVKLRKPITFEQMDGSILGGSTSYACD